jgi:hypothetical protein
MERHGLDWSGSGRVRWWAVVNAVMNLWVPQNTGNFFTSLSRRTLLHGVSYELLFVFFLDNLRE